MNTYSVLIADDEPLECEALEMLIRRNFDRLAVLKSVYNGIDLIEAVTRYHPDIAIVDINMPGLGGLDALEMIRSKNQDMKIIIHSAYSEFEYAKRAFSLHAVDYLVKPIQKSAFVETMQNILNTLDAENTNRNSSQKLSELTGEVTRLVENDIMSSVLLGTMDERSCRMFLNSLDREFEGGFFITVRKAQGEVPLWNDQDADVLAGSLKRVCACYSKVWHQDLILFLIPEPPVSENDFREWIRRILTGMNLPFMFGISTWKYSLDELTDARKESSSALLGKHQPGVYFFSLGEGARAQRNIFEGYEKEILDAAQSGRMEQCEEQIRFVFRKAADEQMPLHSVQVYAAYFLLTLYESCARDLPQAVYEEGLVARQWQELLNIGNLQELEERVIRSVYDLRKRMLAEPAKSAEYVGQAMALIRKYYPDNISIDDIAKPVGISSFYLSRLLKQEFGETFVEVLTRVRIVKALSLLRESSLSVRQIGEMVGYSNTTYFYKVFKKQTGMTVGEVRRYLGAERE